MEWHTTIENFAKREESIERKTQRQYQFSKSEFNLDESTERELL